MHSRILFACDTEDMIWQDLKFTNRNVVILYTCTWKGYSSHRSCVTTLWKQIGKRYVGEYLASLFSLSLCFASLERFLSILGKSCSVKINTVVRSSLGHPLGSTQKVPCRRQCLTGGPFIHCKLAKWEQPKGALQAKVPYRGGALQGHDHCIDLLFPIHC